MIRYFLLDLDGCVTYPFQTPSWDSITKIREMQQLSLKVEHIPSLSICTGRPLPYAEAVAQWLDIRDVIIFESGGGFYHPPTNKLTWSPHFTSEIEEKSKEIKIWFSQVVMKQFPDMMFEFTKYTDVGVVHTDPDLIYRVYEMALNKIEKDFPEFEVHYTGVSVNIIVKTCNKASGLKHFADMQAVSMDEVAYIGDSSGDIQALELVGAPFAPANAINEVQERATVTRGEATDGVLEAYQALVELNKKGIRKD
jgi:HAD superfamily hydrolase (TIGR01484 family)